MQTVWLGILHLSMIIILLYEEVARAFPSVVRVTAGTRVLLATLGP